MPSTQPDPATLPPPVLPASSIARAVPWVGGWLALMLVIAIAGREATRELAVFQVMEMRSLIGLLLLAPLVHASGGLPAMRSTVLRQHVLRNCVHYVAQFSWFVALTMIPLAQVVALEFTMPIWTALLALAFLGERMNIWKALAVACGLAGVLLIVRPASSGISTGQALALASALGFAISMTMTKWLTRSDGTVAIIFWMLAVQSVLGLAPAIIVWRWPSGPVWGWVVLIAFCGTFSHYCMARALRYADATVVVPLDFLRVPLTALAAWLVYAERVDLLMVLGTMLILGGNALNLRPARPAA